MPEVVATDHPIDPAVHADIVARLEAIEVEHDVRVLYACESGSRGWGFASPDSDYDVRFLYLPKLSWYLRVDVPRDVIEIPISAALDINGWELRKALGLMRRGNATLIEWLDSPVVYAADPSFLAAIRDTARRTWQPERAYHHYIHMARGNYREYLHGDIARSKQCLYVLRPLLATLWIERGLGIPPMRFRDLVDRIVDEPAVLHAIERLLVIKRAASEAEHGRPIPELTAYMDRELGRLDNAARPESIRPDPDPFDQLLQETVLRFA